MQLSFSLFLFRFDLIGGPGQGRPAFGSIQVHKQVGTVVRPGRGGVPRGVALPAPPWVGFGLGIGCEITLRGQGSTNKRKHECERNVFSRDDSE